MNTHLNLINTSSEYDLEKINVPNVTYIKDENIVKYTKIKEKITINLSISIGTGTFCAPFDVQLPENVKAYYITNILDNNLINMEEYNLKNKILPAYSPAIVQADEIISKTYEGYKTYPISVVNKGLLYGSLEEINVKTLYNDKTILTLQKIDERVAFYKYTGETLSAYKAFIVQ